MYPGILFEFSPWILVAGKTTFVNRTNFNCGTFILHVVFVSILFSYLISEFFFQFVLAKLEDEGGKDSQEASRENVT